MTDTAANESASSTVAVDVLPADWQDRVLALAEQRDAVILAHNYQVPEIQDIAHHVGDSLGLSRVAAEVEASTIVFCGVHFMAESAKILSPDKTVLIPDAAAGCSLAESINAEQLRWGLENLNVTEERLAELGMAGMVPPFSTSCSNHTGHSGGWMLEWDGTKFVKASDHLMPDVASYQALVDEKAAEYASANAPWPVNEDCN